MSETLKGKVKWFNDTKGYGFIEHESGRDVFVHYSVITSEGYKTLKDGEAVEYEIIEGDKGLHASKVMRMPGAEDVKKPLRSQITIESTSERTHEDVIGLDDTRDESQTELNEHEA
jgi:cold shock protein